jgi:hypothetical protein
MRLLVIICLFGIIHSCKKDQLKDQSKYRLKFLGFESYSSTSAYFGVDLNNEKAHLSMDIFLKTLYSLLVLLILFLNLNWDVSNIKTISFVNK